MASADDVKKLAALARIGVGEAELEKFAAEFDGILAYVGQLDALSVDTKERVLPAVRNVMREDGEPHPEGAFTEALAKQFPERQGNYLSVKQIISHD